MVNIEQLEQAIQPLAKTPSAFRARRFFHFFIQNPKPQWLVRPAPVFPSEFRVPRSAFRHPSSAFRIPHSAFRIPHSVFRIPHSAFRIPHSAFRVPPSAFRHPTSDIRLRVSPLPRGRARSARAAHFIQRQEDRRSRVCAKAHESRPTEPDRPYLCTWLARPAPVLHPTRGGTGAAGCVLAHTSHGAASRHALPFGALTFQN